MAAPTHKITLKNGFNYRPIIVNARAAQGLPMGRAKSFPTSYSILTPNSLRNGAPISLVKQGGNYGGNWMLGRKCSPGYPPITDEWGWF